MNDKEEMKYEKHGDIKLTLEEAIELNAKGMVYGTAYAVKHKDGSIKIFGINELVKHAKEVDDEK